MDKQSVLSFWKTFSDELDKTISTPDLTVLDQVAGYFSPGSYYYYLFNFPKFKIELVSQNYEHLTGLSSKTHSVEQWLESVHQEDLEHVQKCEKVAENFLFEYLSPEDITKYKVSYTYRRKMADGNYQNNLHQAVALNLSANGSLGHVLGIEANVEHIAQRPTNTVSFIHLAGERSYLNISTDHPSFEPGENQQYKLTDRELNIIRFISYGLTNEQIADELFISSHTVKTHRSNILKKIPNGNMTAIVSELIRKGMI